MSNSKTLEILITAKNEASKKFDELNQKAKDLEPVFQKMATIGAVATTALGVGIGFSVKNASNLEESINAVNVVFGEAANRILEFGQTANTSIGLSNSAFNQMATVTGALLKDTGIDMQNVALITVELSKRASDMASVFNTDVNDAMSAINQALRGETEAIRRYAGDVTDATLETYALSQGIKKSVSDMSEQEKRLLRVNLIMEQTKVTTGDFANTSDSLANRQRILNSTITDISAELGKSFSPILESILNQIYPMIEKFSEWSKTNSELILVLTILIGALSSFLTIFGAIGLILPIIITNLKLMSSTFLITTGSISALIPIIILMIIYWDKVSLVIKVLIAHVKAFAKMMLASVTVIIGLVKDAVNAFLNWQYVLINLGSGIIKLFSGDLSGAMNSFKQTAGNVFSNTITGFSDFSAKSSAISAQLNSEVMEYGRLWEETNVNSKLEDINKKVQEVSASTINMPKFPDSVKDSAEDLKKKTEELKKTFENLGEKIKGVVSDSSGELESISKKIKDINQEIENLLSANIVGNKEINYEFAEAYVDQEKKVIEMSKELAEKQAEYNKEKNEKVTGDDIVTYNEKLAKLENEKNVLVEKLKFETAEFEKAKILKISFEQEIEDVKRKNSLSEIARVIEELNDKRNALNEEFQAKYQKIQAEKQLEFDKYEIIKKLQDKALIEADKFLANSEKQTLTSVNAQIEYFNKLAEAVKNASAGKTTSFIKTSIATEQRASQQAPIVNITINGDVSGGEVVRKFENRLVNIMKLNSNGVVS